MNTCIYLRHSDGGGGGLRRPHRVCAAYGFIKFIPILAFSLTMFHSIAFSKLFTFSFNAAPLSTFIKFEIHIIIIIMMNPESRS